MIKRGAKVFSRDLKNMANLGIGNPSRRNYNYGDMDSRKHNYWEGRIKLPKSRPEAKATKAIKEDCIRVVFEYLDNKYPKLGLKGKKYEDIKGDSWYAH